MPKYDRHSINRVLRADERPKRQGEDGIRHGLGDREAKVSELAGTRRQKQRAHLLRRATWEK